MINRCAGMFSGGIISLVRSEANVQYHIVCGEVAESRHAILAQD